MGRIDRSGGQDATMERRHINAMLRHVADYELVKARAHSKYITVKMFYKEPIAKLRPFISSNQNCIFLQMNSL